MGNVIIITVDGDVTVKPMPEPQGFLKFAYAEIGCSLVDVVRMHPLADMWVDDEGAFVNDGQNVNRLALWLVRSFGNRHAAIWGTVILANRDSMGETISLNAGVEVALLHILHEEKENAVGKLNDLNVTGPLRGACFHISRSGGIMGTASEVNGWFERSACKPVLDADRIDYWYSPEYGDEDYREGSGPGPATRTHMARRVCSACTVRLQCLTYVMARGEPEGIWGGLMPNERVKLAGELDGLTPRQRQERIAAIASLPVHIPRMRADSPSLIGKGKVA